MATKKYLIICGGSGKFVLGQRNILGLDGEMQVDASEEIRTTRKELNLDNDPLSFYVEVDVCAPSIPALYTEAKTIALQQKWKGADIDHLIFLIKNFINPLPLKDGMGQAAAVGGLAIYHPKTQSQLKARLIKMLENAAGDSDLEFWIISSTAGGCGEGTHRAISDMILKVLENTHANQTKKIKHIRIGKSTYMSTNPSTAEIQTLLGICADAKFYEKMYLKYRDRVGQLSWYYIDIPDYGYGEDTKVPRGRIISLAAKALMLEELTTRLQVLEVNSNTAIIRTGYWGHEYNDDELYNATLKSFIEKLDKFITPNPEELLGECIEPEFKSGLPFDNFLSKCRYIESLSKKLESKSLIINKIPEKVDQLPGYVDLLVSSFEEFLGESIYEGLSPQPEFQTIYSSDNDKNTVAFMTKEKTSNNSKWYEEYRIAHIVREWAREMLGLADHINKLKEHGYLKGRSWYAPDKLIYNLFGKIEEVKKAISGTTVRNSGQRATSLSKVLPEMIELIVKVKILLDNYGKAEKMLLYEEKPNKVLTYARKRNAEIATDESIESQKSVLTAPIIAEMDHLQHKTWFDLLKDCFDKDDRKEFKKVVLQGAVVLTEVGLKEVLGLPTNETIDGIKKELLGNVGRMLDSAEKRIEALWMSNHNPLDGEPIDNIEFRLLPQLVGGLEEQIGVGKIKGTNVDFVFPPLGVLSRYVLALQGVTIAPKTDWFKTPVFLIQPLVDHLKELLENWGPHVTGEDTSRMKIALSGVIGDPLGLEVLQLAGFTAEEINKLSEYFVISKQVEGLTDELEDLMALRD